MKNTFFVAALMLFTSLSAQTITSNFNANNEGWQIRDNPLGGYSAATYRAAGGNPTGHISARDILPVSTMYFVAPSKFLGNKSWAYDNVLSFDLKIESGTFFSEDDVIIEGNGVVLALDLTNPNSSWSTFTCTFNENSGWRVGTRNGAVATKVQIQSVLCNLARLWIRAEFYSNFLAFDEGFLDNVRLGVTPCTASVLNLPNKTICAGQSVVFNRRTLTRTGVYSDTIKRCYPQCDSVTNLNLTVVDAIRVNKDSTICSGNSIKIGNKTLNKTGIYKDTIKTPLNCDTIRTINLTVSDPSVYPPKNYIICDIESILIGNKNYNKTGIYRDTLRTNEGCDSIVTTNLTVNKSYAQGNPVVICPNSSYTIGSNTYTQAGVYRDVLKTINGCDSIVTTTLTIGNAIIQQQPINLCNGQTFAFNGRIYAQTGIYRDTFRTLNGCDSIIITDLTINSISSETRDTTICKGDFIRISNKIYTLNGIYKDTLKTINGCDSLLITTNLKIIRPLSIAQDTSICKGDFVRINNKNYAETGVFKDTLKTNRGCDSVLLTLNLNVFSPINLIKDTAICKGDFIRINNKNYTQTGVFKDTLKTIKGCDSVLLTLKLNVFSPINLIKDTAICKGDFIRINGKNYTETGVFKDTLKTNRGCDSVLLTLKLNVFSLINLIKDTTICKGDFVRINNKNYAETGVFKDTLKTNRGCDSVLLTLKLNVFSPINLIKDTTICKGDFVRINNKNYAETGVFKDTLKTIKGCDSVLLTLKLNVFSPINLIKDTAICKGDFVRINGKNYAETGVFKDTLKTIKGCDSVLLSINLKIIGPLSITRDSSICKGDFIRINNKNYTQAGVYSDTLKSIKGCDSLFRIVNLTIKPERKRFFDSTICEGKTLTINAKSYQKAGIYTDTINLNGQCDSILLIDLKIKPYAIIKKNVVLCNNDSTVINGRLFTKIGVFKDTVKAVVNAAINCDEIIEWTVTKSNLQLNMGINRSIELGDSVQLDPSVSGAQNVLWAWQLNKTLSCTDCPNPIAKPLQTTTYALVIRDTMANCTLKDAIKVSVKPCESIFMPTAFSPNNDGANDYFAVFASGCVRKVIKMQLFNRWGVMVFSKNNFFPNNEKEGWNGRMNDTELPPDVYIYVIELELGDGRTKVFSGDVTLVR